MKRDKTKYIWQNFALVEPHGGEAEGMEDLSEEEEDVPLLYLDRNGVVSDNDASAPNENEATMDEMLNEPQRVLFEKVLQLVIMFVSCLWRFFNAWFSTFFG